MSAAYHAIPQAPVPVDPLVLEDVEDDELIQSAIEIPPVAIREDARIKWIHFILGCGVLLPWNGAFVLAGPILCCSRRSFFAAQPSLLQHLTFRHG